MAIKKRELTFESVAEAKAWDQYVAGLLADHESNDPGLIATSADDMIIERRKRIGCNELW